MNEPALLGLEPTAGLRARVWTVAAWPAGGSIHQPGGARAAQVPQAHITGTRGTLVLTEGLRDTLTAHRCALFPGLTHTATQTTTYTQLYTSTHTQPHT